MSTMSIFQWAWVGFGLVLLASCSPTKHTDAQAAKPRIVVSSDIGGTDPDDFQSMIHLLMYADQFQIEGIVASPFEDGRKEDIWSVIDLYEQDLPRLSKHSAGFPDPDTLRNRCKQGAIAAAPYRGYSMATEGSEWIIHCAKKSSDQPLWILVWGGIEDVAQALHDAPEIKDHIRVYWIGGPNKKWSTNAYAYLAAHHSDLWMIEANATYRGWFMDKDSPEALKGENFYANFIKGGGAMGADFANYYGGKLKMGDTPSLAYLMNGNPDTPQGESWGGEFVPIGYSPRRIFEGGSSLADTVAAYAVLEWRFVGPELEIPQDSACFKLKIHNQLWPGYCLGDGQYAVRYTPKRAEAGEYVTISDIPELNGLSGAYVSVVPFPGEKHVSDYRLGANWYTDRPDPSLFIDQQQGAQTVAKHREAFLADWAKRWAWLRDK